MKKKVLRIIAIILIIVTIITIGLILIPEKFQKIKFIKEIKKAITANETNLETTDEITKIDITNLKDMINIEHEHIIKTMYDEIKHWEECTICNMKQNEISHSFTTTWALGKESCNFLNSYTKTCKCGYSETGHKPCVWNGNNYFIDTVKHTHERKCNICNNKIMYKYYLNKYGSGELYSAIYSQNTDPRQQTRQFCHLTNGNIISCQENGKTCSVCGTYYENKTGHRVAGNIPGKEGKIVCIICGKEFGTFDYMVTNDETSPTKVTITVNFKLTNGAKWGGRIQEIENPNTITEYNEEVTKRNSELTEITLVVTARVRENIKVPMPLGAFAKINIDGITNEFGVFDYIQYSGDYIPPTITQINVASNEWTKSKPIVITGTENYCDTVTVEITDEEGKVIYTGGANVINKNYSISCTPEVEADVNGRTFYVKVTDTCENTIEKEFKIAKVDSIPPEPLCEIKINEEWAKSKQVTFSATDKGIGNVQIAFNDINDYTYATFDGEKYTKQYQLTGDVYSPKTAKVLYKDELGNTQTQSIIVNKLDNTAPSITKAEVHNNQITIQSNDRHETLGEGSGVSKYKYITSAEKLQNPIISDENSKETKVGEKITIDNISQVKYIYVIAIDLVGNISEVYEIEVPELVLKSSISLELAEGKGGVILDWSDYDITDKIFVIYRKQEGKDNFETIVGLNDKFNGSTYTDNYANDKIAPNISENTVKKDVENNNIQISPKANDAGTTYTYYIEAYDSNDTSKLINKSNIQLETI